MPNPTRMTKELEAEISQKASEYAAGNQEARIAYINGAHQYAAIAIQLRNALQEIHNLPGYRQDEASQLASEALALFPVDDKNSKTT